MASSKISWNIPMTKFLINAYESNECLYNTKHQDYKIKTKRLEVYTTIARQIYDAFGVECSKDDLQKKINGLRTQYQSEKLKVTKSIKSGADADSIYTPTVYWFPLLKFLDISLTADDSMSNLDELSSENYSLSESSPEPRPSSSQSSYVSLRKRRTTNNSDDTLLHQATRTMHEMSEIARKKEKQDYFDTFGSFVASELRSISLIRNEMFALLLKTKIQKFLLEAWEEIERESIHSETSQHRSQTSQHRSQTSQHRSQLTSSTSDTRHGITDTHIEEETYSFLTTPQSSIITRVTTGPQTSQHRSQLTLGASDTRHDITDTHTEEETYSYIINEDMLTQVLSDAGVTEWDSIQLELPT